MNNHYSCTFSAHKNSEIQAKTGLGNYIASLEDRCVRNYIVRIGKEFFIKKLEQYKVNMT